MSLTFGSFILGDLAFFSSVYLSKKICSNLYKLVTGGRIEKLRSALKLSGIGGGAATGAKLGILLGSVVPGLGNVAGMIIGGVLGGLAGFLFTKYSAKFYFFIKYRMKTPEQRALVVSVTHPDKYQLQHPSLYNMTNQSTYDFLKQIRQDKNSIEESVCTVYLPGVEQEGKVILNSLIKEIVESTNPDQLISSLNESTSAQTHAVCAWGRSYHLFKDRDHFYAIDQNSPITRIVPLFGEAPTCC